MTTTTTPAAPPSSPRQLRRAIVRLTIGSFSVAALLGIIALLSGGQFGETEGRVLLTTLLVGAVSVAVLCYLATAGKGFQAVGVAGGVAAVVPFVTGLLMIWSEGAASTEWLGRTFGVGATVAATLAQVSLLLALCEHAGALVRRLLGATLASATLVALIIGYLIAFVENDPAEWLIRLLGVVAILDVLGTVTVAALMKFGASTPEREASMALSLPSDLRERLDAAALEEGRSASDVAADAIERYLGRSG